MIIKIDSPSEYELKDMLWSGAEDTLQEIIDADKFDALENYIDEIYEGEIGLTEFNDILRFDSEQLKKDIGMFELDEEIDKKEIEKLQNECEAYKKPRGITNSDMAQYELLSTGEVTESELSEQIDEITDKLTEVLDAIDSVLDSDDMDELESAKDDLESAYSDLVDVCGEYLDSDSRVYDDLLDFDVSDMFTNI